ncbi:MAG: hypothetical protein K0R39_2635 [Symbiobacteriaceae bacterium]|jgi:hypothetical protein|nr:hypothetical protein [Symbiobacteriaceae bacterium]
MRKLLALLLIATFALAAGCSKKAPAPPLVPPAETTAPVDPPPADPSPAGPRAADYLPKPGSPYFYHLNDGTTSTEYFFSDGERLIGSYNGKAYLTWFSTEDGVWRPDPQGSALLRYLPPVLQHALAWKQKSGNDEVFFLLEDKGLCRTDRDYYRPVPCWELSVLNRQEVTVLHFSPEIGVIYAQSVNYKVPSDSYIKRIGLVGEPVAAPPVREQMLKDGATLPSGPLPAVTSISPVDFHAAVKAMRAKSGALLEIDLNGDGKMEVVEGPVGSWHTAPLRLYGSDGLVVEHTFADLQQAQSDLQHRVDVVQLKGVDRPVLMYQLGAADRWHQTDFKVMEGDQFQSVWGWHPKTNLLWMASVRVSEDGIVVAEGDPASMGGYRLTRRYHVEKTTDSGWNYVAKLDSEEIKAGAYPTAEADLLTAALVAHWFGLESDLARYVPDAAVRGALAAGKIGKPNYTYRAARVGKLTEKRYGNNPPVPDLEAVPVAQGQPVDFLVEIGQYEGYVAHVGKVVFGKEAEGRLVIRKFELTKQEFIY